MTTAALMLTPTKPLVVPSPQTPTMVMDRHRIEHSFGTGVITGNHHSLPSSNGGNSDTSTGINPDPSDQMITTTMQNKRAVGNGNNGDNTGGGVINRSSPLIRINNEHSKSNLLTTAASNSSPTSSPKSYLSSSSPSSVYSSSSSPSSLSLSASSSTSGVITSSGSSTSLSPSIAPVIMTPSSSSSSSPSSPSAHSLSSIMVNNGVVVSASSFGNSGINANSNQISNITGTSSDACSTSSSAYSEEEDIDMLDMETVEIDDQISSTTPLDLSMPKRNRKCSFSNISSTSIHKDETDINGLNANHVGGSSGSSMEDEETSSSSTLSSSSTILNHLRNHQHNIGKLSQTTITPPLLNTTTGNGNGGVAGSAKPSYKKSLIKRYCKCIYSLSIISFVMVRRGTKDNDYLRLFSI